MTLFWLFMINSGNTRGLSLRPPELRHAIPAYILRASVSVAILWDWHSWALAGLLMFHTIARPGEVFDAVWKDVFFPPKPRTVGHGSETHRNHSPSQSENQVERRSSALICRLVQQATRSPHAICDPDQCCPPPSSQGATRRSASISTSGCSTCCRRERSQHALACVRAESICSPHSYAGSDSAIARNDARASGSCTFSSTATRARPPLR